MEMSKATPPAASTELDVPQLATALVRFYRIEIIPDVVSEFESWGFEKEGLREKDDDFFAFCALGSYDRQPFTFKGGYQAVWSEDPGSVRRLLESKRLLKFSRTSALSEDELRSILSGLVFGPWRLAHDRKRPGAGGTDYARTLKGLTEHTPELRALCTSAVSEWDVASLHYRFDSIHGIGPTIAAKLVKYLLRELQVAEVDPANFGRLVPHLLQEYANSPLLKRLSPNSPQTLGRRLQAEVAKFDEPLAVEAIFYADKNYDGRIPGRFMI
jgi:hypothetical protein